MSRQYSAFGIGLAAAFLLVSTAGHAGSIADREALRQELRVLADRHPGRVGICAQDEQSAPVCVNGDERFPLQSVMKLVVGAAVMAAADGEQLSLNETVTIRREDLSVFVQPIEKIVAAKGSFTTTIKDLVRRAVAESDSTATDVLIARLGGPGALQKFLVQRGIQGVRIDRDERHLQADISGLSWDPDYVFPGKFAAARKAVPDSARDTAYKAYMRDERDTATPKGMTAFLHALATGKLLSPPSTDSLLAIMSQTVTFPDRLRAGVPAGWTVSHKTGTSPSWRGISAATNDVGVLMAPDGSPITITAFVADSQAPMKVRAALIAAAAHAVTERYR